jgi:hypothetical protein
MNDLKTFFKRNNPDAVKEPHEDSLGRSAQTLGPATQPLGLPIYYEAWGGLESANKILWTALWFAVSVSILTLILLRAALNRPPVVILLGQEGQAQVVSGTAAQARESKYQPPVSQAEIKNFLSLFERFFTELDCYTYNQNLKTAFSMMTPEFKTKAQDLLERKGLVENIKADELKTKLTLTDISIVKETPQLLECDVKGWRDIGSFKPDGPHNEIVFEDEIILKKVPRSEKAPDGVLVENWSESLFKK